MAKIAYVILAHELASQIAELAALLSAATPDASVVIHYDRNASTAEFTRLKSLLSANSAVHFVEDRVKCGWGTFGLVDGVIRALKTIRKAKIACDNVMLVSGSCMPIRPLAELSLFLDEHPDTEFIEAFNVEWIGAGLRHERYQYRHVFNFQTQYPLFHYHFLLQRTVMPRRKFPVGLEPKFGSQWWCLTWETCAKVLDYIEKYPRKYRFFKTTWIPDEMFFQTMVTKVAPTQNIARRNLTFYQFNSYGKPWVFHDDHAELMGRIPYFFARKISPHAKNLKAKLAELAMAPARAEWRFHIPDVRYTLPIEDLVREANRIDDGGTRLFVHTQEAFPGPMTTKEKAIALVEAEVRAKLTGPRWQAMLEQTTFSFAILYGPPEATTPVANALRGRDGLTVLGRLFHPNHVDFGPGAEGFKGLRRDDNAIRDMDRGAYMTRVLTRANGLAVFEMTPGDDRDGEKLLFQSGNAIFIPVLPKSGEEIWRHLFWSICALRFDEIHAKRSQVDYVRAMQAQLEDRIPPLLRDQWNDVLFRPAPADRAAARQEWEQAIHYLHGDISKPLTDAINAADLALESVTLAECIGHLPEQARAVFSALDSASACFGIVTDPAMAGRTLLAPVGSFANAYVPPPTTLDPKLLTTHLAQEASLRLA